MSDAAAAEATIDDKGAEATGTDKGSDGAEADKTKGAGDDKGTATAADGGDADEGKVIWPEKWREQIAGGDEKKLARLGHFDHPGRMFESYQELEKVHKDADIRSPFPDEASDKDKNKWRKDNGIPKEATGYFDKLPDGLVIGEEDKQGMETLAEAMHAIHAPTNVTHAAMAAYYKHVENVVAERAESDAQGKKETDDSLHELYGADFRRNINDLNAWVGAAGGEVKAKIFGSRTPDGTPLGNDPEVLKWFIGQMRAINPLVTVPGLGGGDPAAALDDEIAEIEKTMKTDFKAYSADKQTQSRYLTLLAARDKRK